MVEVGAEPAGVGVERPAGQPIHVEAEPVEQLGEAPVQLEAPSAPALLDDLGVRPVDVHPHPDAVEHVQILERHRDEVGRLEPGQRGQGRLAWAVVADAGEVSIDVHSAAGLLNSRTEKGGASWGLAPPSPGQPKALWRTFTT